MGKDKMVIILPTILEMCSPGPITSNACLDTRLALNSQEPIFWTKDELIHSWTYTSLCLGELFSGGFCVSQSGGCLKWYIDL